MSNVARPLLAHTALLDPNPDGERQAANDTQLDADLVLTSLRGLQQRVASHPVSDALRAHYLTQITAKAAARAGRRCTTGDVLADVAEGVPRVIEAVMAGEVRRFGPYEMRFTIDLAVELTTHWSTRRHRDGVRAARYEAKVAGQDELAVCCADLYDMVSSVTPDGTPERAALERSAKDRGRSTQSALAAIGAMRTQAQEILQRGANDPAFGQYLTDKGFTEAWLAETLAPVTAVAQSGEAHGLARAQVELTQQAIDVLEGRVRDQLLRLRRRVEEARARGALLPAVPFARVRHGQARAKDATSEPETPAPPSPAPR